MGKVDCWNPDIFYKLIMDNQESENMKLMKANRKIRRAIAKRETIYSRKEFLRDWKRIETTLEKVSRYPLIWKDPRIVKETDSIVVDKKLSSAKNHSRPRCFFDIELQNTKEKLGRIVFELYSDFVPRTCANFEAFCRGHNGLSYKGTSFFNILPGYWCQGGDVTKYNGTGGTSIYGETFQDENFNLRHARTGVLSMWSNGEHTNNSKFNLTFRKLRTMNGKRVVFGKVIKGLRNLFKIEELGAKSGKPLKTVVVGKCGVLDERKESLTWSIENKDSQMIELKEEQQSM
ncbi:peptidyl-prolyl cis-trans isomerase isoform X2 [Cephus cinctus]|uniref:Peptidyl-prolyl cis-trans isomerase n=1 Tax=Cephus cinctus TaxID=211228 RepID=A0AAJ7CBZ6_CEPCN|nr:peptidyl-prolyl cis-trans isomerase isoform X2 [Cephus cinctus]